MDAYLARFQRELEDAYDPEIDLQLPGSQLARRLRRWAAGASTTSS